MLDNRGNFRWSSMVLPGKRKINLRKSPSFVENKAPRTLCEGLLVVPELGNSGFSIYMCFSEKDCDTYLGYCDTSLSYCNTFSSYCNTSPSYCDTFSSYCDTSPSYCDTFSSYCDTSPSYCDTSPSYCDTFSSYCDTSPSYCDTSASYCNTSQKATYPPSHYHMKRSAEPLLSISVFCTSSP
ncbi:hypothetical protein FIU87_02650 [Bacillus sp. THAF10]|nr:hypothetical protein FIU87_02650 [Bacillus sp. THAF10]